MTKYVSKIVSKLWCISMWKIATCMSCPFRKNEMVSKLVSKLKFDYLNQLFIG